MGLLLIHADEVQLGDRLCWCDREILVLDFEADKPRKRRGTWIVCDVDGKRRSLHYYNDEEVVVVRPFTRTR